MGLVSISYLQNSPVGFMVLFLSIASGTFLQLPLFFKASIAPSFQRFNTLPMSVLNVLFSYYYENLV